MENCSQSWMTNKSKNSIVLILKLRIMKKKVLIIGLAVSALTLGAINLTFSYEKATSQMNLPMLLRSAFAQTEQPNTDDCVSDPNYDCEALHPTDPSKDTKKENAKWE